MIFLAGRVQVRARYRRLTFAARRVDKANLRRKCRNNFKTEDGVMYYRKNEEKGRVFIMENRTCEDEMRILESLSCGFGR